VHSDFTKKMMNTVVNDHI